MRNLYLAGALAILALAASQAVSRAEDPAAVAAPAPSIGPCCGLPVTKSYRIKPGFCPQALVYLIPKSVGQGPCCCNDCGPYGIPPIYAAGQYVLVRQTPEMQERVVEFLTELGAIEPKKAL